VHEFYGAEKDYITMRILDKIRTALICHTINVEFDKGVNPKEYEPYINIEVFLKSGKLVLVDAAN
jgi:hypothetical protein